MANVVDFISQSSHSLQSIYNPFTALLTLFTLLHEEEMLFRVEDVQDVLEDCKIPQIVRDGCLSPLGVYSPGLRPTLPPPQSALRPMR